MRMAKDPEKVKNFLVDLAEKLRPLQDKEVKVFLDYKKEEVGLYLGWLHLDSSPVWHTCIFLLKLKFLYRKFAYRM